MTPRARSLLHGAVVALLLAVLVSWGWLQGTGRTGAALVPHIYGGDAWGVMAQMKAYQTGELLPFVSKEIEGLGAPFGGNWTDYPAEDLVYLLGGMIAKVAGIEAASALVPIVLLVLAAIAFYAVGRALGYAPEVTFACAVLFGVSPFAFFRGVPHLTLTAYAHVPLLLAGVLYAWHAALAPPAFTRLRALALAGAVLAGFLNPYFLALYLVMLAIVFAGALIARERAGLAASGLLMGIAVAAFVLNSLDSLWMALAHGGNPEAVVRSLVALDIYGLRLPDLVFPLVHRWEPWQAISAMYHNAVQGGPGRGEAANAYIGLVAAGGLALLLALGTAQVAARRAERVSPWFWLALITIGFGIVGGINHILGSMGFVMLRASNRFSIVLMAIALLWIASVASRGTLLVRAIAAVVLLAFGLWDQVPPPRAAIPADAVRAQMEGDRNFVAAIERGVPAGTRVFQLPVKGFPETGPIHGMQDYEHLRPYFYSTSLSFSYGSMKGRGTADWQRAAASLEPAAMVEQLAAYGFGVLYLNRHAYADGAAGLKQALDGMLGAPIAERGELVAWKLPAAAGPVELPRLQPLVRYAGFWPPENDARHTWAWASKRNPAVDIRTPYVAAGHRPAEYQVHFSVDGGFGGAATVKLDGQVQGVVPAGGSQSFALRLPREQGRWRIEITSEKEPMRPGNGDLRRLGARLVHLYLSEIAPPAPEAGKR